jgi:4-amino-4-deoxy-L-arabinose transferase-like glycosyltransferase
MRQLLSKPVATLTLIVLVAVAARVAVMPADPTPTRGSDEDEYDDYAWNLAQGRGYRGPSPAYSDREHLTSWRMPGPSIVFAAFYAIFGHYPVLAIGVNIVLSAATCVALYFLAHEFYPPPAGIAVAAIYAVWPHAIHVSVSISSEPLYVLLLTLFVLSTIAMARRFTATNVVLSGVLLGATLYARPHALLLPFVAFWIALVFWKSWGHVAAAATVFAVAGAMLLPWIVRNYKVHDSFVPFTTQAGEALLLGANRIVATDPKFYGYALGDARLIPEYKHQFDGLNEVDRSKRSLELYKEWMSSNRDKWWYLTHSKFRRFWTPFLQQPSTSARLVMLLSWGPVLLLFVPAFLMTFWRCLKSRDARLMVHFVILSTLLNSIIFSGLVRYRFPIEGLCILFAVGTVFAVYRAWQNRPDRFVRALIKEFGYVTDRPAAVVVA